MVDAQISGGHNQPTVDTLLGFQKPDAPEIGLGQVKMAGIENDKNSMNFYPPPADFDQSNQMHPTSIFDSAVPLASAHSSVQRGVAFTVDSQGFELKKRGDNGPEVKSKDHSGGVLLDFTGNGGGAAKKAEAFSIDADVQPGMRDAQNDAASLFQRRMEER